jgi:Mn2+/Fe2+ NRAMP family transporter
MYGIQEMAARIGYVTDKGLVVLMRENFSRLVLYPVVLISALVIMINIGADLLAIGVVAEKIFPSFSRTVWIPIVALGVIGGMIFFSYQRLANVLKWFALTLFFYIAAAFYISTPWREALRATLLPSFTFSRENLVLLAAIFGTTISPYLFFWQTDEEREEREEIVSVRRLKRFPITAGRLRSLRRDTLLGMGLSNLVMWFIMLTASQLVGFYGVAKINSFDEAALVLQPFLGESAYLIFSLGIIGTGLLAIPVLAGSVGYMIAETFDWHEGLNKTFREAKGFYAIIAAATLGGMLITLGGLDPVNLLIYTAVFYMLITPILVFLILKIANNKKIMKGRVNGWSANILGGLVFIVTTVLTVFYLTTLLVSDLLS